MYHGEKKEVCPAKTKLETKVKGLFTNSKAKFTENTDFKALSPEFHAISTSKHSYVWFSISTYNSNIRHCMDIEIVRWDLMTGIEDFAVREGRGDFLCEVWKEM